MQGYQRHAALSGGHCLATLNPCPIQGLTCGGKGLVLHVPLYYQPDVPVSPGHVSLLHPYPPNRRRRR
jgi:hypothetical protein